jgi:RNA polymerase sigma-70 factor (ECF subfamily)
MTAIEDQALVRVGRGDPTALAEVYDDVADVVYGLALRIVGDSDGAAAVAHDAFVDVWRTASHFDPSRASATGWITAIAHRRAVEHVRSTTAGRASQRGHAPATRHALGSLTPPEQEALELAYFSGCSHRDVAAAMEVSPDVAASHLGSALVALRRWLDPTGAGAAV